MQPVIQREPLSMEDLMRQAGDAGVMLTNELAESLLLIINDSDAGRPQDAFADLYAHIRATPDELRPQYLCNIAAVLRACPVQEQNLVSWILGQARMDIDPKPRCQTGDITKREVNPHFQLSFLDMLDFLGMEHQEEFIGCLIGLEARLGQLSPEGIISLVAGADKNLDLTPITLLETGDSGEKARLALVRRFSAMTAFLLNALDRLGPRVTEAATTGSDPHLGGKHAVFFTERGRRQVYKPHSLQYEALISGKKGLLAMLNKMLGARHLLATLDINPRGCTEERIARAGGPENPIPLDEIPPHLLKLGMLESAMSVFGVTDLHAENIIFSPDGPIAVDGECGLNYLGTNMLFGPGSCGGEYADYIERPSQIFIGRGSKRVEESQLLYGNREDVKDIIRMGTAIMDNVIIQNQKDILNAYRKGLNQVDRVRLVPISTRELAQVLEDYVKIPSDQAEAFLDRSAAEAIAEAARDLSDAKWAFNQPGTPSRIRIEEGAFIGTYKAAFRQGTLPAMELCISDKGFPSGTLLMDDVVIGSIGIGDDPLKDMIRERAASKIMEKYSEKIAVIERVLAALPGVPAEDVPMLAKNIYEAVLDPPLFGKQKKFSALFARYDPEIKTRFLESPDIKLHIMNL